MNNDMKDNENHDFEAANRPSPAHKRQAREHWLEFPILEDAVFKSTRQVLDLASTVEKSVLSAMPKLPLSIAEIGAHRETVTILDAAVEEQNRLLRPIEAISHYARETARLGGLNYVRILDEAEAKHAAVLPAIGRNPFCDVADKMMERRGLLEHLVPDLGSVIVSDYTAVRNAVEASQSLSLALTKPVEWAEPKDSLSERLDRLTFPVVHPYDELPEPPPSGGNGLCTLLVVAGRAGQVARVLDEEFTPDQNGQCCLVRLHDTDYWYIEIVDKTVGSAEAQTRSRIGYVSISDRPAVPIKFYALEHADVELISTLADEVANELKRWQFRLEDWSATDSEPMDPFPDDASKRFAFGGMELCETIDWFESWLKSYLRACQLLTESQTVKQRLDSSGQQILSYFFSGCIVAFHSEIRKALETRITPAVYSREENLHVRQKALREAEVHVNTLLRELKRDAKWQPIKPSNLEDRDAWFDYYHECKAAAVKYTLKDLATEINLAYGTVRQLHRMYKAERNL